MAITSALIASAVAILLAIAGMGGFDPSRRAISYHIEGTDTQVAENPARPEQPGFPPSTRNNLSSSSGIEDNNPLITQGLLEPPIATIVLGHF